MGETTKIQWCDHTFNPWRGCQKVAPGCANCYAESQANRNPNTLGIWGPNGTRVVASESAWREPGKWNRAAAKAGERHRVFCGSMMDWAEDWKGSLHFVEKDEDTGKPINTVAWCRSDIGVCKAGQTTVNLCRGERLATMDDARADLFGLIDSTPHLDWLLLTKRPENIRRMVISQHLDGGTTGRLSDFMDDRESRDVHPYWRKNVWLGTSIACQQDAVRNVPELLKCRDLSPVLFLSIEPMVGPVDISPWMFSTDGFVSTPNDGPVHRRDGGAAIDWVIVGGESGPNARPCQVEWIRAIVRQCREAGVPCFVKQCGANVTDDSGESRCSWPGLTEFQWDRVLLRDQKGGDPSEWPADLRVREFPEPSSVC